MRIGLGRDIHRLEKNARPFILGGVNIPFEKGNVSHSDGDCLYHAVAEALLGGLALGDLGHHFPDNDDKYLNMDSSIILSEVMKMVNAKHYHVVNLDVSIILEKPKLQIYLNQMRENVAQILNISKDFVSIKAQTNEQVGEVGANCAVEVIAIILLEENKNGREN